MDSTNLEILLSLKDEASAEFKKSAESMKSTSSGIKNALNTDVSGFVKWGAAAAAAGAGMAVAFGISAIKGFGEAQVAMAKIDATLDSMAGRTIEVATGARKLVVELNNTGVSSDRLKNSISGAQLEIKAKEASLGKLRKALKDGTITQKEYNLRVSQTQNQIEELNLKIKDSTAALGETTKKYVDVTKSVSFTSEALAEVKKKIEEASLATVKLGFDDEATAVSMANLFQRTGDVTKAIEYNNIAMDLARAKNMDLESASNAVGLVLSGNTKILKQFGIEIDESKTPIEQLGELQQRLAGQSQAYAETFPGQLAVITESWSNMKDQIGEVLVNALGPFVKQFSDWLTDPETQKRFKEWTAEFQSWAEVIIPVVIDTFKLWYDVLSTIFDIMLRIGDAIIAAVDAAKELGSAIGSKFGGGRASGGPVSGGTTYLVGENGPELFTPSSSGSIIPNGQLRGGGVVVNINGGYFLSEDVAERLGDLIIKRLGMSNSISV